jgi:hypothetical protein
MANLHFKHETQKNCLYHPQQYIDEIKNIEKCKQNLKSLAKPVLGFLKEEQPEAVEPIKSKIEQLGEQIFR